MKHVFTLLAFALMSSASAQTVLPPNYPYNPDSDGDEFVAVSDVLMSVASYDNEFQAQSIMVDTLSLEEAIQILLQQQSLNQQALIQSQQTLIQSQQDLIEGLTNSLAGVEGFEPCLLNWTCGCPLTYQGYDYATIQIGEQCWFAENLRTSSYRNGDQLLGGLSDEEWSNATEGAQCAFADNDANVANTGRLYNYIAVVDQRGMCPSGWHVPVDAEWVEMANSLGGVEVAGLAMKNSESDYPSWDGTNSSGFSGAPGGKREMTGAFGGVSVGYWWTSTPLACGAWHRNLHLGNDALTLSSYCDVVGFSVRCIKDSQ